MYYQFMPEGERAKTIRDYAARFLESRKSTNKFTPMLRQMEFITEAVRAILHPFCTTDENQTAEEHFETVREVFVAMGETIGEMPYDSGNPEVVWTWVGEALEMAGVANEEEADEFVESGMDLLFIPASVFQTIMHCVEETLSPMALELCGQVETA